MKHYAGFGINTHGQSFGNGENACNPPRDLTSAAHPAGTAPRRLVVDLQLDGHSPRHTPESFTSRRERASSPH